MNALHPQFVVDENQTPTAVLLPVAEWEQVGDVQSRLR